MGHIGKRLRFFKFVQYSIKHRRVAQEILINFIGEIKRIRANVQNTVKYRKELFSVEQVN